MIVDFGPPAAGAVGVEPPAPGGTARVGVPRPDGGPAAAGPGSPGLPEAAPKADGTLLAVEPPEAVAAVLLAPDPLPAPVGAARPTVDCVALSPGSEPDAPGSDDAGTGTPPDGITAAVGTTPPAFLSSWTRVPHPTATSMAKASGIQARHDLIVSLLGTSAY